MTNAKRYITTFQGSLAGLPSMSNGSTYNATHGTRLVIHQRMGVEFGEIETVIDGRDGRTFLVGGETVATVYAETMAPKSFL